ncbi:MAG: diguanylate cyclase, partial [Hydrogenophilaceae bacterium]
MLTRSHTSLRHALLVRFGVLAGVTALLVGLIFALFGLRPMSARIADNQFNTTAEQVEARLTATFAPAENLLRMSSRWVDSTVPEIERPEPFNRLFLPMLETLPQITSVVAGTSTGQGWMLLQQPNGSRRNRFTDIPRWGSRHQVIDRTATGDTVQLWQTINYDARLRPWYAGAMATPEQAIHWTAPYAFFTTGEPGVTASIRSKLDDGRDFVLGFDIKLRDLSKSTMLHPVGRHGLALVITDDRRVLTLPARPEEISEPAWLAKILAPVDRLDLAPVSHALAAWSPRKQAGGVFGYRSGNADWLASIRPYQLGSQRFWLITLAPEADFAPAWQPVALAMSAGMLLVLLAAILIAYRQAGKLSRPLEALAATSERIGKLDFSATVPVDSDIFEIAQLASAQAGMTDMLRSDQERLAVQAGELHDRIEALQQAKARLRESEQHFRNVANGGSTLIWMSGLDKLCTYFNDPWLRFTGRTLEQELGNGWLEEVHPEDRPRRQEIYVSAFDRGEPFGMDYRLRAANGEYRWLHDEGLPRYDSEGLFQGYIGYCFDITERKQAEEQIHNLAYFDPLTNLPNRRLLMDRLNQALIASKRAQTYGALLIMDLDNFKTLNDTQGHDAGDQLLIEVAGKLLACVRQNDTVARLGGDEYVVMLEGLDEDESTAARQAEVIGEKIRTHLNQPFAYNGSNHGHHVSTSIGLTLFRGQDISSEGLLKQADVALYQAKDNGKNVIRFFNPAMQAEIDARMALEGSLRRGIENSEFRLHYQPQFDQHGRLIGAEALLRWLPPGQPPVPPDRFIGVAEDTGLILPIGLWVLETACAQLKVWEA